METIATYCIVDSLLTIVLFDIINKWVNITYVSIDMRTRIRDLYTRDQKVRVRSQLYKGCYDKDAIFDKIESLLKKFEYDGAIVSDPTVGLYR